MVQKREPCRKEGTEWKSGIMASEDVDANQPMRETAERRVGKLDIISIMPGIGVTRPLVATKGRARWALCVSSLRQAVRVDWSSFFLSSTCSCLDRNGPQRFTRLGDREIHHVVQQPIARCTEVLREGRVRFFFLKDSCLLLLLNQTNL